MHVHERISVNRRRLADFFDGLDEGQLAARSLCDAWTVREVLGHLVTPLDRGLPTLALAILRNGGSVNRASESLARDLAMRPVSDLTDVLRARADQRVRAPGVGPMGQMADGCIHLRDCARPLGLSDDVELGDWRMVLGWLVSGVPGLVPRRRVDGLMLVAIDQDWTWGSGEPLEGPSEALAMAVAGRTPALDDLVGAGVDVLRSRF